MREHDDDPALLKDLYEHAPCGFLSTLADGTIVKVNRTFLAWTGLREESLLQGTRFQELLAIGDRIFYETHFAPLMAIQGSVHEIAVDLLCADRRRLPVLLNSTARATSAGRPATIRTCVFRATDRREYERELLRARQRAQESEARARVLAQTLQQSLIPSALPPVGGLEVAGGYRPAGQGDEVGGDFYDLFETASNEWGLILGDVCGKGAEAAVVTSLARYTVRAVAAEDRRPSTILRKLNAALLRQGTDRFCTAVYVRVHRGPGGRFRLTVCLGGHAAPLRVTADGTVSAVGRPGHLLGVLDEVNLVDDSLRLDSGDTLLLFTDGVNEARGGGEFFDEARLRGLLSESCGLDAQAITDRIMERVLAFQDDRPRDDVAIVALKATGPSPHRRGRAPRR
jgi:sigma-B regulation protein RsbU (phosphoserine phosphatase)